MPEMVTKLPLKTETKSTAVEPYGHGRAWYPLESLRRGIDRMFSDFDMGFLPTSFGRSLFDYDMFPDFAKNRNAPPVDVTELADGFEIKAELPGIHEKDIEVKIANGGLLIKGVKKEEKREKEAGYVSSERYFGSFERYFRLPDGIELEKIQATYANGVLTVVLPKTVEAKKQERTITVKAA